MENGPFSTPEFDEFAQDVVLFTHITSHIPGEKYADLLQEKGGRGFPHLVIMDAAGDVLATHEGPRTVEAFRATAKGAQHYVELKALADPTPAQRVELLLLELQMGKIGLEEGRKRRDALGEAAKPEAARIEQALTDLEVRDALEKAQPRTQAEAEQLKADLGQRFQAMLAAGRHPTGEQETQAFYGLIMEWAEKQKDPDTFEKALSGMRERFGKLPAADRFFKQAEERLARLRQK